jgi:5-methylcytosine-specific restriction protein B
MATPLPTQDIRGLFKSIKDDVESKVLTPRGLVLRSCGTKDLALGPALDAGKGFWQDPHDVSSKPPRWIVQVTSDAAGTVTARLATDPAGALYQMAKSVGFINNGAGNCAAGAFRVLIAVRPHGAAIWSFPNGWECLLLLAFSAALQAGTAADPLTGFDPVAGTVEVRVAAGHPPYSIGFRAVIAAPGAAGPAGNVAYLDAVKAVAALTAASFFDGTIPADRDAVATGVEGLFAPSTPVGPFALLANTALAGIDPAVYRQIEATVNSGKRHIILYGPPGTGKTTLAEYLAKEISTYDGGSGSYVMLTASTSWSAQDLVGGYQPLGGGNIGFIPGVLLREFDKPLVIDELNRCPIDRVLGPLFSVLSGQASTLPCRVDVANSASPFHVVLPVSRNGMAAHEHAPGPAWRLICTLNTIDKTQLGQISYALSRRFAWIKVGAPPDPEGAVVQIGGLLGLTVPNPVPANPVGVMWARVNGVREIGGAPIVDLLKMFRAIEPTADVFAPPAGAAAAALVAAFRMCVLPLMDGLTGRDARGLGEAIGDAWNLDAHGKAALVKDCEEFSA